MIGSCFRWIDTGEGMYWSNVHQLSYEKLLYHKDNPRITYMNDVEPIDVPEYEEEKWMQGARLDYMIKARDGIKVAFDWSKTKQGHDYWKNVYTKLYIMCKHMEVYAVMRRLSGDAG